MFKSFEKNNNDADDIPEIDIFSTSLTDKSIIFSKIHLDSESDEEEEKKEKDKKYNSVLLELKINSIHKYYRKKNYDMVLSEMLKYRQIKLYSNNWKNLIDSI